MTATTSNLIRLLLHVGGDLYLNGYENDAMSLYESAHWLLMGRHQHENQSFSSSALGSVQCVVVKEAQKRLEMGSVLLKGEGGGGVPSSSTEDNKRQDMECGDLSTDTDDMDDVDDEEEEEEQVSCPDLYLDDECDVGPRVIRLPAHIDSTVYSLASNTASCAHLLFDAALSFNMALILQDNLDFSEAKRLYQLTLQFLQSMLLQGGDPRHFPVMKLLMEWGTRVHNNLGHIFYMAGDEETSRAHFEAALTCTRQLASSFNHGSRRHRLMDATVLSNWCRVNWMKRDPPDFTNQQNNNNHHRRCDSLHAALLDVLRIRLSMLDWNHADVAAAHFNVGLAEYARHDNVQASAHLMQYLRISADRTNQKKEKNNKNNDSPHSLDVIPALIYLQLIQNEDKDDNLSRELVRGLRTLLQKREEQGSDSPEVASVLNYVGTLLFHKEDHTHALLFFEEELRIEECLPSNGDDIAVSVTCNNIGRILQELGKLPDAIIYYHRVLKPMYGDIKSIGSTETSTTNKSASCSSSSSPPPPPPPSTITSLSSATAVAVDVFSTAIIGDADAATSNLTSGLTCPRKKIHECRPSSANLYSTVWYNLGLIHDKLSRFQDAIAAFEMSLELRRAMLGSDHPDIACLMYNIGVLQMEQQDLGRATCSFREALRIRRRGSSIFCSSNSCGTGGQLSDKHVVKTLEKLSSLHKAEGNVSASLDALKEVLYIQEMSLDYDVLTRYRETGATLRNMAELQHAHGNLSAASSLAMESVQKLRDAFSLNWNVYDTSAMADRLEQTIIRTEQLVSSLLLVGSLHYERGEPVLARVILGEAMQALNACHTRTGPHLFSSLQALNEVTQMLAASHCAEVA